MVKSYTVALKKELILLPAFKLRFCYYTGTEHQSWSSSRGEYLVTAALLPSLIAMRTERRERREEHEGSSDHSR